MKREIKFRAWDKGNNQMIFRGLFDMNWYATPTNDENGCHCVKSIHQSDRVDLIVMQYTGLKDKNGVEIYEGDIVYDSVGKCIYLFRFGTITHTVKSKLTDGFNDVKFTGFYVDIPKVGNELLLWEQVKEAEIEVIGNIYENPELL